MLFFILLRSSRLAVKKKGHWEKFFVENIFIYNQINFII